MSDTVKALRIAAGKVRHGRFVHNHDAREMLAEAADRIAALEVQMDRAAERNSKEIASHNRTRQRSIVECKQAEAKIAALEAELADARRLILRGEDNILGIRAEVFAVQQTLCTMYKKARRNLAGVEEYDAGHLCDDLDALLTALSTDAGAKVLAVVEVARMVASGSEKAVPRYIDLAKLRDKLRDLDGSKPDA